MATQARKQDYIQEARGATRQLWEAYLTLLSLQPEWNGQDYGSTLGEGFEDAQGNPNAHAGLTSAQIGAVVFDTVNAIKSAVVDVGHATNITNIL